MNVLKLLFLCFCVALSNPAEAQIFKKKEAPKVQKSEAPKKKKNDKIKPYSEVITKEAVSDSGLIITHKIDGDYFFEIPRDLMEKEMLIVTRISGFVKNLNFGGAGVKSRPQQVIRWQEKDKKVMLRSVSYNSVADHDDPVVDLR